MNDDPWGAVLGPNAKQAAPPPTPAASGPAPGASPAQGTDPWHGVLGGAAPPAGPTSAAPNIPPAGAGPPSTYDPNWSPTGNAFLDFMLKPRAKTEGVGAALKDYALAGLDYGTQGFGTKALGLQGDADTAKQNLGIMNYPTAAAAYVAGPGKILGPLARGSAVAEGALAGGTSAIGHGDTDPTNLADWADVAKQAAYGAIGGKLGETAGKYGGAAVRWAAGKLGYGGDPAAVTAAAQQAKTDAYSVFDDAFYHPSDIGNGVGDIRDSLYSKANDPDGSQAVNSPTTRKILNDYYNRLNDAATSKLPTSGSSLNDTIKQLGKVANKNPSNFEGVAASQARDGLTDLFHNTTPVSAPPGFNAATAQADAAAANSQFKNAEALEGWQREISKYGGNVGNDVKAYNEKWYGQTGTPEDSALMGIYDTQQQAGTVPRWATAIAHEAIGGALGEAAGAHLGLPHGVGAGLGMLGTYGVAKPAMGAVKGWSQGLNTQQAFDQAYQPLTSRSLTPVDTGSLRAAMRQLGVGAF